MHWLERRPAPPSSDEWHGCAAGFDGSWEWAANYSDVPGDYGIKMSSAGSQDNYFPARALTQAAGGCCVLCLAHERMPASRVPDAFACRVALFLSVPDRDQRGGRRQASRDGLGAEEHD